MFVQQKYPSIGYKYGVFDYIIAFPIIFIVYNIASYRMKLNADNWYYQTLLKNNFGIYLFHPIIIYTLFYFKTFDTFNRYIQIGLIFSIALIFSTLITSCIKKRNSNL